jgi:hypothetical protein
VQVNYSLAEPEAERRLLRVAADHGVAVLVNRPFAQGAMFRQVSRTRVPEWAAASGYDTWTRFFVAWILAHPAVTCIIPATRNPEQRPPTSPPRPRPYRTRRCAAAWPPTSARSRAPSGESRIPGGLCRALPLQEHLEVAGLGAHEAGEQQLVERRRHLRRRVDVEQGGGEPLALGGVHEG